MKDQAVKTILKVMSTDDAIDSAWLRRSDTVPLGGQVEYPSELTKAVDEGISQITPAVFKWGYLSALQDLVAALKLAGWKE